VVDMQNDFGAPEGMFARAGIDISGIRAVIAPTGRVRAAARAAGMQVVYLKMAFRPDLSDAGLPDAPNWLTHERLHAGQPVTAPDRTASRILIRDTWNTAIVDELTPEPAGRRDLQAPVQRVLPDRTGRDAQGLGHPDPRVHRLHDQRVRGVHPPRRWLQGA
jgi:nicotinamidase-related amidase